MKLRSATFTFFFTGARFSQPLSGDLCVTPCPVFSRFAEIRNCNNIKQQNVQKSKEGGTQMLIRVEFGNEINAATELDKLIGDVKVRLNCCLRN